MEQIFVVYSLPKETVTSIMILFKNTKAIVCYPDDDTVIGVLQGDILAPYTFIICLDYVL